jgi:hypothetical protein
VSHTASSTSSLCPAFTLRHALLLLLLVPVPLLLVVVLLVEAVAMRTSHTRQVWSMEPDRT